MGILNLTQDSFYDGGFYLDEAKMKEQISKMVHAGAKIIDIGAMSSRPGALISNPEDEIQQLLPSIQYIIENFPEVIISVDTIHSVVAKKVLEQGVHIINDISGGQFDKDMYITVGSFDAPYVLMHMRGEPSNMQEHTDYEDLIAEMLEYFIEKIERCRNAGIKDIIIDPGFGFSKTLEQNYLILKRLSDFSILDCPILIGLSRKSMIWKALESSPNDALNGTTVLNTIALQKAAHILRVHDVREASETIKLVEQLKSAS